MLVQAHKDALEHYGSTNNILEAGYILPCGTMLDFSEKHDGGEAGMRSADHRDVGQFMDKSGTAALIEFMNSGAIRLMPECGGIDITIFPTQAQIKTLYKFIGYYGGEIMLDISSRSGNNIFTKDYRRKTAATTILNDIKKNIRS